MATILLLYAEHTWGHSATVTNPYDTMVTNLDMRKTSYASKAHEAAAMRKMNSAINWVISCGITICPAK